MRRLNRRRIEGVILLVAGVAVVTTSIVVVHKIRRRRSHFLPAATRRVLEQLVSDRSDHVAHGGIGGSLFEHTLGRLTDKQLIAVFAAVSAGNFIRQSGFDPLHPDPEAFAEAAHAYTKAELAAPSTREAILVALHDMGPALIRVALRAALNYLS